MKNRNSLIMSGLLALTLGLGVSGTAFAYQGDYLKRGQNYSQEFENQMTKVMTSNDYLGWKLLVQDKVGRVDELINKDNFPKFAEAWRLAKEGKIKQANAIRNELGLKAPRRVKSLDHKAKGKNQNMGQRFGSGAGNRVFNQ